MLLFKKIDAYAQLILIVAGFIFSLIKQDEVIILSYFVVGGWQVLSVLIHFLGFGKMPVSKGRKWFLIALLLVAITGVLCVVISDLIIFFLIGILFISPLLAIWYAAICFGEIKLWERYQPLEIT